MSSVSSVNSFEYYRQTLRNQMNEYADHISGGACKDYSEYSKCARRSFRASLTWAEFGMPGQANETTSACFLAIRERPAALSDKAASPASSAESSGSILSICPKIVVVRSSDDKIVGRSAGR